MVRIWSVALFPQGLPAPRRQIFLAVPWWSSSSWLTSLAGAACTARQPPTAFSCICLYFGMLALSTRYDAVGPSAGSLCLRSAPLVEARIRPRSRKSAYTTPCPLHARISCLISCCLHPSGPNLDQWGGSPTIHYSPIPTNLPPKRGQRSYKRSYPKGDRVRNTPTQKGTEFTQTLLPKRGRSSHKPPTQKGTEVTQTLLPKGDRVSHTPTPKGRRVAHAPNPKGGQSCTQTSNPKGDRGSANTPTPRG